MGMLMEATTGRIDPPDFSAMSELVVPVRVTDRNGMKVMHADITTWVTPTN